MAMTPRFLLPWSSPRWGSRACSECGGQERPQEASGCLPITVGNTSRFSGSCERQPAGTPSFRALLSQGPGCPAGVDRPRPKPCLAPS